MVLKHAVNICGGVGGGGGEGGEGRGGGSTGCGGHAAGENDAFLWGGGPVLKCAIIASTHPPALLLLLLPLPILVLILILLLLPTTAEACHGRSLRRRAAETTITKFSSST